MLVEKIYNNQKYQAYLLEMETASDDGPTKVDHVKTTVTNLQVFNSNENPLFLARDIGVLMGIQSITSTIKHFNNEERVRGYIISGDRPKTVDFLTKYGVMRALWNSRSKIADVFRGFIYRLLDYMSTYELDKLKSIMNQYAFDNPELMQQSMQELHENSKRFQILYNKEKEERDRLMAKNREAELKLTEYEIEHVNDKYHIEHLNTIKDVCLQKMHETHDTTEPNVQMLQMLKKRFMKEVNIAVVKPVKPLTKKKHDDIDKTDTKTDYDYAKLLDFDEIAIDELELYYFITMKPILPDNPKYTFVCKDWILDKNKFKELYKILASECETIKKSEHISYFKTTLAYIKETIEHLTLADSEPTIESP